jgi:menaquinone-dependent protoporphyrinogen oxidase
VKVLVAYASKAGSTREIAEFIGEKLRGSGAEVDVRDVASAVGLGSYDAFVVGSALYMYHWINEAREFVSKNRSTLASKPVWIFSSGPTGLKTTDKKGRDLREVSGPKELGDLQEWINPRDHRVFFGAFYADRLKGSASLFARMIPKDEQGDFRNRGEIEGWVNIIASDLSLKAPA